MKKINIFLIISLFIFFLIFIFFIKNYNNKLFLVSEVFGNQAWSQTIEYLPELEGVGVVRAENCGKCHVEIYKEWQASTHANAFLDLQFQAELTKQNSSQWLCLNCHIPVLNQRETIVTHLINGDYKKPVYKPNLYFDPTMQQEGVTCATCHVRTDSKNKTYVIGANGNTNPPHPVKINKTHLNSICKNCHESNHRLSEELVCSFGTWQEMEEWQALDKTNQKKNCVTCHLPEVERTLVIEKFHRPKRKSHIHGFIGGGVPKKFELYDKQISYGYKSGIQLLRISKNKNDLELVFENAYAGHYLPTGDPERFLLLELEIRNKLNEVIEKRELEIGQKWEWSPVAKKISDNRLKPKEVRVWREKDILTKEAEIITFSVTHIRMRKEVVNYVKESAKNLNSPLREKLLNLDNLYPIKSKILESKVYISSWKREDTNISELMQRNFLNL